jgi:hypothetical protein
VSTLDIIPAEVSGSCDVATGECVATGPGGADSETSAGQSPGDSAMLSA